MIPGHAAHAANRPGNTAETPGPALGIELAPPWLRIHLGAPHRTLGWTIVGGGWQTAEAVCWLEVTGEELAPPVDPRDFVRGRLARTGRSGEEPVLVTGCAVADHFVSRAVVAGAAATCVATVGLGNALRAGDPPGEAPAAGTINLLCVVSQPLSELAQIEALSVAVEARTAAVLESGVASVASARPATGTGTDCAVIAAPLGDGLDYAGKHTAMGAAIGAAVLESLARGVAACFERSRAR